MSLCADGLRRRHAGGSSGDASSPSASQSIDATSTYPAQSHIPVGVVQAGTDPIQQMAAMQQIYAQYMAYMQ